MIQLVDDALEKRIREDLGKPSGLTVTFTPPNDGKPPGHTPGTQTLGIYLYDVREDLDRRLIGTVNLYDKPTPEEDRKPWKIAHHDPPRYARLSYLVTVWTSDPKLTHALLGDVLIGLARDREFVVELPDPLVEMGLSALLEVGRPPVSERPLDELWTAVGHFLQPVVNVTVVLPLPTHMPAFYTRRVMHPLRIPDQRIEFADPTPPPHWKDWPPKKPIGGNTPASAPPAPAAQDTPGEEPPA
ncbi:Pvc16 family protein [Streptomyces sp. NPDC047049]|uniref:Pvc16 family protein n=1 Tax=Streptomyces sp. NPDC047049 TaxID=3156688 RepID=UPI0033C256C7